MGRVLLVEGKKVFRVTIPEDAKVTFGPWSPPTGEAKYNASDRALTGTLRVYQGGKTKTTESILAVFSDVRSFRDLSAIEYEEQIVVEKGSIIWESDRDGYKREEMIKRDRDWLPELESGD